MELAGERASTLESPRARSKCGEIYLGEVEGSAFTAIVIVPVHVQDLLAIDGEERGEDTLCDTGAENDGVCDCPMRGQASRQRAG